MPSKDFQRDLKEAIASTQFPHLCNLKAGDHDNSLTFTFCDPLSGLKIDLQAIVSDSRDYPDDHSYFVFTTSDDTPPSVTSALENSQSLFLGLPIQDFLGYVDEVVENALWSPDGETDQTGDLVAEDDFDAGDDWEAISDTDMYAPTTNEAALRQALRRDLRTAKQAGFKVGYLGLVTGSIIVSVSCRIAKLGISEEAMKAWDVQPSEYLVLLIRYPETYKSLGDILALGGEKTSVIQFHVGTCDSYKPSLEHALQAFHVDVSQHGEESSSRKKSEVRLKQLFIERPLNSLLNDRFLQIVEHRCKYSFSWTGAELYVHESQGKMVRYQDCIQDGYFEPIGRSSSTPALLLGDHVHDGWDPQQLSLPLLAMQFTLRHFARCTEFCLVCHCKIRDSYEAVKPYVCSNGLCLFQYMALGMGTNLEHEIRCQPNVVDLLVSLTYARAASGKLMDFPTGLGLRVPAILHFKDIEQHEALLDVKDVPQPRKCYSGTLKPKEMICSINQSSSLKAGDWIVIYNNGTEQKEGPWHCRVQGLFSDGRQMQLSPPVISGRQRSPLDYLGGQSYVVKFVVYDRNFDDLDDFNKRCAIRMLLGALPGVEAMKTFLGKDENNRLSAWKDVVSPAALDILRWVVASNRSFITEDGNDDPEHRIPGMEGFFQFRLVQGAPDKERRFANAVTGNTGISRYPTIFAWHGSPIQNWHSILREGLHYKEVAHGRSFGDGVYLSHQFDTSIAYCRNGLALAWPQSRLGVQMCISLNEVVNAPSRFRYAYPHYVLQQLDWIQPRYLFVKCVHASPKISCEDVQPSMVYKQEPKRHVIGPTGDKLTIPITAFSSQRRCHLMVSIQALTRRKMPRSKQEDEVDNDDAMSVGTVFDDFQLLLSDNEDEAGEIAPVQRSRHGDSDFEPGTLDRNSLPLLSPPKYATTPATKALQQHLQATLKVQSREPLHDLGWYIDPEFISTVYQWIVELHSFDIALPLAKDLKAAKLKSVVLELRFPPAFPMAPPFIRVIRPRFLEFAAGGGGHVTSGGAMCMELLTNSGWLPTASIESVLLQVRMALTATDPHPARLAVRSRDYTVGEAVEAYKRACRAHGWQIPEDIQCLSW